MGSRKDSHLATYLHFLHPSTTVTPAVFSHQTITSKWCTASPTTITPYGIDLGNSDGQRSLSDPFLDDAGNSNGTRSAQPNANTTILWDPEEVPSEVSARPLVLESSPCATRQQFTDAGLDEFSQAPTLAANKHPEIRNQLGTIKRLQGRHRSLSVRVMLDASALVTKDLEINDQIAIIERLQLRVQQLELAGTTKEIEDKMSDFKGVIEVEAVG